MNEETSGQGEQPERSVPISWEALEDAFENNAHEVHSYLHVETGEVIRVVDGVADPAMHNRIMADPSYLRVDPVSSREQYRWMERFIATVDEPGLRHNLLASIDGKGAFRRFKDVLMSYPVDRERWFTFRSERLRFCMEAWLSAHDISPVDRPEWQVPSADEVVGQVPELESPAERTRGAQADAQRQRLLELAHILPARDLETALAFLEFLRQRQPMPRTASKVTESGPAPSLADATESGERVPAEVVTRRKSTTSP